MRARTRSAYGTLVLSGVVLTAGDDRPSDAGLAAVTVAIGGRVLGSFPLGKLDASEVRFFSIEAAPGGSPGIKSTPSGSVTTGIASPSLRVSRADRVASRGSPSLDATTIQAIGRAGRGERAGRAIVQTYQPAHPAIVAAASDPQRCSTRSPDTLPTTR